MNRVIRVLLILLCFEMGVLLVLIPWSSFWERNYFLNGHPEWIPILLNPYLRGAITGLGFIDIGIAAGAILRRRPTAVATRS